MNDYRFQMGPLLKIDFVILLEMTGSNRNMMAKVPNKVGPRRYITIKQQVTYAARTVRTAFFLC